MALSTYFFGEDSHYFPKERTPDGGPVRSSADSHCMLSVARDLRNKGIPVELTIHVDSVGIDDVTVPSNVKEGAIFHARDPLVFMTTKRLKVEDSPKTKIVANILVRGAGHLSITRDPRIRELVVKTVERLRTATNEFPTPACSVINVPIRGPSRTTLPSG